MGSWGKFARDVKLTLPSDRVTRFVNFSNPCAIRCEPYTLFVYIPEAALNAGLEDPQTHAADNA